MVVQCGDFAMSALHNVYIGDKASINKNLFGKTGAKTLEAHLLSLK